MNPFDQIELMAPGFTKTDTVVCEKLLADVDMVMRCSATELAERHGISQAAISRFCQKLGYRGYADFKEALYRAKKSEVMGQSPSQAIDTYVTLLKKVPAALEQSDLVAVVELLSSARQVICTGYHKSALPAQLLAINLNQLRMLSHFEPFDVLVSGGYTFSPEDAIVIFSVESGGYRPFAEQVLANEPESRPRSVLVTMSSRHPLRNKVDHVIWLPSWKNQNMAHYAENQVVYTVFCDLLTASLTNTQAS